MNNKKQTHFIYGLITALAMIIVGVILIIANLNMKPGVSMVPFLILLIGLIMNGQAFSKANDADVTFGQLFGSCFKATAIVALLFVAWSLISLYLFPQIHTQAIEQVQQQLEKQHLSEEQMDMSIKMMQKYFKVAVAGGALFYTMILGAIFSLIAAAIARKAPRRQMMMQ